MSFDITFNFVPSEPEKSFTNAMELYKPVILVRGKGDKKVEEFKVVLHKTAILSHWLPKHLNQKAKTGGRKRETWWPRCGVQCFQSRDYIFKCCV